MKITVKSDSIEIIVEESSATHNSSDGKTYIRYADQNQQIQSILKEMVEQCIRIKKNESKL